MAIILFFIYGALAIVQAAAIYSLSYEVYDFNQAVSALSALLIGSIPIVGSVIAAYAAFVSWHLSMITAVLIFVIPGILLLLFAIPEVKQIRRYHRFI